MAQPTITYNAKTIVLQEEPLKGSFGYEALPPRTVNTALAGSTEVITIPRCDVTISGRFYVDEASLVPALENWQQWALQGNAWTFAYDGDQTASTTLNGAQSAGASTVTLASVTGIRIGDRYAMKDGPFHQVVTVESISGSVVTIVGTLDNAFATASIFRDQYFISGEIRKSTDVTIKSQFLSIPGHVNKQGIGARKPLAVLVMKMFEAV